MKIDTPTAPNHTAEMKRIQRFQLAQAVRIAPIALPGVGAGQGTIEKIVLDPMEPGFDGGAGNNARYLVAGNLPGHLEMWLYDWQLEAA